jgi:hypothetical protein
MTLSPVCACLISQSGASLEIRYVRLKQGKGIIRKRSEFNLRRQVSPPD